MNRLILAVLLPAGLGACAPTPLPDILPFNSPANTQQGIRGKIYEPIIGEYTHREPADPKPWRPLNDEQAPKTGGGS